MKVWPKRIRFGFLFVDRSNRRFKSFCDIRNRHIDGPVLEETSEILAHFSFAPSGWKAAITFSLRSPACAVMKVGWRGTFLWAGAQLAARAAALCLSCRSLKWLVGHWWRGPTSQPFLLWVLSGATLGGRRQPWLHPQSPRPSASSLQLKTLHYRGDQVWYFAATFGRHWSLASAHKQPIVGIPKVINTLRIVLIR